MTYRRAAFRPMALAWVFALSLAGCAMAAPPAAPARCPDVDESRLPTDDASLGAIYHRISPLLTALSLGQPAEVARLLAAGEDPNLCVFSTPLLAWAATSRSTESIRQLLDAGAGVDRPLDSQGASALFSALGSARFATADLLLDRGADPLRRTDSGGTALHRVAVSLLSTQQSLLTTAAQLNMARRLLDVGVPPDAPDRFGRTALMSAAAFGAHDLVKLLLDRGADPLAVNQRGDSAVSAARRKGDARMIDLLTARPR